MPDYGKPSGQDEQPQARIHQAAGVYERLDRRNRRLRTFGYTLGTAGCIVCLAAGTVFGRLYWGSESFRKMVNEHGFSTAINTVRGNPLDDWTPDKQFPGRTSMNVLIMGVDHDYDNRDRVVKTTQGRSDSILVAHIDFVNKTINALTIPRDSAVHIPDHRGIHKINAAHNFGGPDLSIATIKSVFGIDSDYYVELNFEGFQKIVNSLGGIDVDVKKKLDYDDNWGNLHIHLRPGYQHLDGYRAMGYVRMRHSDSDEMRSERQHEFLEALRGKIKDPTFFVTKLPGAINALNDNLKRSPGMSNDQLLALANFARTLPKENIQVATLPSFEGPSYVTIDAEKSAQVIQRMFFPNQMVALNIDAPDPNSVRAMNAPYERGSRRHSRKHKGAATRVKENGESSTTGASSTDSGSGSSDTAPPSDSQPTEPATESTGGGPGNG